MLKLPDETVVYCAHEYTLANLAFAAAIEPQDAAIASRIKRDQSLRDQGIATVPSTLSDELLTNPFLRCDKNTVIASAEGHAGKDLDGRTIRPWPRWPRSRQPSSIPR